MGSRVHGDHDPSPSHTHTHTTHMENMEKKNMKKNRPAHVLPVGVRNAEEAAWLASIGTGTSEPTHTTGVTMVTRAPEQRMFTARPLSPRIRDWFGNILADYFAALAHAERTERWITWS